MRSGCRGRAGLGVVVEVVEEVVEGRGGWKDCGGWC